MDATWLANLPAGTKFVFGHEPLDIAVLQPDVRIVHGEVSRRVLFPHLKAPLRIAYDHKRNYIHCVRKYEDYPLEGRLIKILPPESKQEGGVSRVACLTSNFFTADWPNKIFIYL